MSTAVVGVADAKPERCALRPGFGAIAMELHDPGHARHFPVRLRVCPLLILHASRDGSADRPLRLGAAKDRSEGPRLQEGRNPHALGAAAGTLMLRAGLSEPAGRGRVDAGARQPALRRLSGDLWSWRVLCTGCGACEAGFR